MSRGCANCKITVILAKYARLSFKGYGQKPRKIPQLGSQNRRSVLTFFLFRLPSLLHNLA